MTRVVRCHSHCGVWTAHTAQGGGAFRGLYSRSLSFIHSRKFGCLCGLRVRRPGPGARALSREPCLSVVCPSGGAVLAPRAPRPILSGCTSAVHLGCVWVRGAHYSLLHIYYKRSNDTHLTRITAKTRLGGVESRGTRGSADTQFPRERVQ